MYIQFQKEPNWVIEASLCLRKFYQEDYETITSHYEDYGMLKEEMKQLFQPYLRYKEAVMQEVKPMFDQLIYLKPYIEYTIEEGSLLTNILFTEGEYLLEKLSEDELEQRMKKKCLDVAYQNENKPYKDDIEHVNFSEMFRLVNESESHDRLKILLLNLYQLRVEICKELRHVMNSMIQIMKKHYSIIQLEFETINTQLAKESFEEKVGNGEMGVRLYQIQSAKVYSSIFGFNTMMASGEREIETIILGMYTLRLLELRKHFLYEAGYLASKMKVLADATRIKILRLLSKQSMYIQELSRKLEVTPATVSHHISILMKEELITCVVDTNHMKKVYYEVKKEGLRELGNLIVHLCDV